jgi:hypothetical protein
LQSCLTSELVRTESTGAARAIYESGRRIPEDISPIGCDNSDGTPEHLAFGVELIERQSCQRGPYGNPA